MIANAKTDATRATTGGKGGDRNRRGRQGVSDAGLHRNTTPAALQWHVAFNSDEPVALATPQSAESGVVRQDVLLVVADCVRAWSYHTPTAAVLARHISDAYHAHEAHAKSSNKVISDMDVALWLAKAVSNGLQLITQDESAVVGETQIDQSGRGTAHAELKLAVVAAVIHGNQMLVACYGSVQVHLLRDGTLQNLTDESFTVARTEPFEPNLGQLNLVNEDRVLLSTDAFHQRLDELQIKAVLRSTPSSRRAAQMLLDAATRIETKHNVALAVADYVALLSQTGAAPITHASEATAQQTCYPRRSALLAIAIAMAMTLAILIIVTRTFVIATMRNDVVESNVSTPFTTTATASPDALIAIAAMTETATKENEPLATATTFATLASTVTLEPTSTEPIVPTVSPTQQPAVTPQPAATATPEPTQTPTSEPTLAPTLTPTLTPSPTATLQPTRRASRSRRSSSTQTQKPTSTVTTVPFVFPKP